GRLKHQEHIKALLPDLADNARYLLAFRYRLVNGFAELLNEVLDLLIQRHLPVICWNAPDHASGIPKRRERQLRGNSDYRLRRGSGSAKMKDGRSDHGVV